MQVISSKENELIKHIKKLKNKKYRDESREFIVEGIKLVKEAIEENAEIKQIVICENCQKTDIIPKDLMYEIAKFECIYVTEKIFSIISDVNTPQGILAVIGINNSKIDENEINFKQDIIIALDNIQDPGNLGSILRTIDSAGLKQVLISSDTVDCYNPKVIRSTMGAIFRVKIIECENLLKTLQELQKHKFQIVVTSLQTKNSIYNIDYNKKVLVIGNEANGVEQQIQDIADVKVKIPMLGKTESLNASVATGIILYEYVRRKITQ